MANRTTNYGFIKPTKAESANVDIINANMESIDDILHDTQISLAPAYDQNETYNTGDKVQFELLMYKCKEDGVTGAWDSTKWERTTAVEGSGGGADLDIYGEASGTAEASFSDGAEASLVECEIGIVPTQDLHGYSKPWAGGAGKNKFDVDNPDEPNKSLDANGDWTLSNYYNGYIFPGGYTYTLSMVKGTGFDTLRYAIKTGGTGARATSNMNDSLVINANNADEVWIVLGKTDFATNIMIEIGSQATTFEPYSNICPISGHTDVTVTVSPTSGGSGEDTTVSLGRTVYKGWVNLTTGEGAITGASVDLGSQTYTYDAQYSRFYTYVIADMKVVTNRTMPLVCSCYETIDDGRAVSDVPNGSIYAVSEKRLYIHDNRTTSPSDLATALNGQTCVYELATPQTFTLTKEQIQTLLGQNYVSHDGGGTISLVYIKKDSTIIPNPAGAEIPLTGLEINGEKFKISGGNSEIIPITAGNDTTSRTFTFSKTPKFIKFYWDDTVIEGTGWVLDAQLVWGQAFINYLAHARYTAISSGSGASAAISYGADGKSITITGGNAFGAMNTSNGTGLMFVEY